MRPALSDFDQQIFVNCPFDEEYSPLLKALVFTILECGLVPRLASDEADSGRVRVEKIRALIQSCRLSIHDISRVGPLQEGDLPRFNMPFELGLDFGCRFYGSRRLTTKQCLILEQERYRYQKVLSDISGNDIRAHEAAPKSWSWRSETGFASRQPGIFPVEVRSGSGSASLRWIFRSLFGLQGTPKRKSILSKSLS